MEKQKLSVGDFVRPRKNSLYALEHEIPASVAARVVWVEEKPYEIPAAGRVSVQFPDSEPTPQMFEFEFELVPAAAESVG